VAVITGEGGSGGALALAVADVVIALENAVYSVITPEGCASILWRTPDEAPAAARAMRMTAAEQLVLGVVDVVVPEPQGGAQVDPTATARLLRPVIVEWLDSLVALPVDELVESRYRRFRGMGPYTEVAGPALPAPQRPGLADRLRNLLDLNRWAGPLPANPPGGSSGRDELPAHDEV
jgi:acetyl-CoA carboxylase carboxyl transferase subunit beta